MPINTDTKNRVGKLSEQIRAHKRNILLRFLALTLSTPLGTIITTSLIPLHILLAPGFQIILAIFYIACVFSYIRHVFHAKATPIIADIMIGAVTGIMLSGAIALTLIVEPVAIIFAASTTSAVLIASFVYAWLSDTNLSFLHRHKVLKSLGLTTLSGFVVYLSVLFIASVMNAPIILFMDAILFGVISACGIVAMMHHIIHTSHLDNTENPSKVAFELYSNVVDLFINVLRAFLYSKEQKESNNLNWTQIVQIGSFVLGLAVVAYLMITGKLFEVAEDKGQSAKPNQLRQNHHRADHQNHHGHAGNAPRVVAAGAA